MNVGVRRRSRAHSALMEKRPALNHPTSERRVAARRSTLCDESADTGARVAAARELAALGGDAATEALGSTLSSAAEPVVRAAAEALGSIGAPAADAAPALEAALARANGSTWEAVAEALSRVDPTYRVAIGDVVGIRHRQAGSTLPDEVIENVPSLIGHMDLDERYTYVNRAYAEWAGKPVDEIVGTTVRDVFGDAVRQSIDERLRAAFGGAEVDFTNRVTFHGVRERDIRVRYVPDKTPQGDVQGLYVILEDVTDLVRTVDELQASESRLHRLVSAIPDSILRVDSTGVILDLASPRHPEGATYIGRHVEEFLYGEEPGSSVACIARAIATREMQGLDLAIDFHGDPRQFEARYAAIDNTEVFVIVRDVTGVRRLEDDLRELNQQLEERVADRTAALAREAAARQEANSALAARAEELERVMRDARCIIWQSNIEQVEGGRLVWTPTRTDDPIFRAVLPLTVEPGDTYLDAWRNSILPDDKERMDVAGNQAVLNDQAGYVQTYTCVDGSGSHRRIREDVTLRRTGPRTWEAVGVAHDVTSLAEAEEVTQRLATRFRAVFQNAPVGMLIRDAASSLTHTNLALHEMLGYSEAELRPLQPEDLIDPRDWNDDARRLVDELRDGTRDSYSVERRYVRKNGESFWVHLRVYVVRDNSGELLYSIAMLEDISARRAAQAAIESHERERARLLQRVVDIQEEERARIAYELHDQIGQQLTSLLLGLKAAEASTEISDMRAQTAALREDTTQAVDSVRQMAFDMRPAALDDMGAVTALRRDVEALGGSADFHAVFRAYDEDAVNLTPEAEVALYRVVSAALTNIVQHAQAKNVSVIIQPREDAALAVVEDDGRGFDAEAIMDGPVEARFGLLAMQERIANVGGDLTFESSVGEGSVVRITLPMQRPDP